MVGERLNRTIARIVGESGESASDAELVHRFAATRDNAAFAILVRRHGPMVFGVCRRMLGHVQDAEDAFQATFVVLARRAHVVRAGDVSRFLYGVAVRVANKARVRRARQLARQAEMAGEPVAPDSPDPIDWLPLLDSAIARLSERDRGPILLCDLQGRSRSEAAAALGIAEGTLSSRLARAREKLRGKLARLGAALSLPALAAGLAHEAGATAPNSLIELTITSAGTSIVRQLAEGVIRAMFLSKLIKFTAPGILFVGALAAGVVWLPAANSQPTPGTEPPKKAESPPPEAKKTTPPAKNRLPELQKERVDALREQLDGQFERVKIGKDPMIQYIQAVRELGDAELELATTNADRVAAVERMLKELREAEEMVNQLWSAGLQTKQGVAQIKAARLKAEIDLEKLKAMK